MTPEQAAEIIMLLSEIKKVIMYTTGIMYLGIFVLVIKK